MRVTKLWGWGLFWLAAGYVAWGAELPLTLGGETAYPLTPGAWLIGPIRLPGEPADFLGLHLRYGLTDQVQLGIQPVLLFLGLLNGELKYGFGTVAGAMLSAKASVAVPFDLSYLDLGIGGYLSFPGRLAWHMGVYLSLFPGVNFSANLAADFTLFPWLHLLGEGSFAPPRLSLGSLVRLWELGLLRAVVGVEFTGAGFAPFSYLELFALFGPR